MADALISPAVAVAADAISITLIAVAAKKAQKDVSKNSISLMGVLGAFVFAAQMINFSIPGTGSSGHIIGGVLLASLLGPWCAFLTICSVLIVQCLVFADGGIMALGCNILNMGAMTTLVAYPLIFKPLMQYRNSSSRLMWASVLTCVIGLELGAVFVSLETVASGITALPLGKFMLFMVPIHFAIGIIEGVATGAVLIFVSKTDPSLLIPQKLRENPEMGSTHKNNRRKVIWVLAALAVVFGGAFTWLASSNPDGLEWSIEKITGSTELAPAITPITAFMPDYESYFSGIVGCLIVLVLVWAIAALSFRVYRHKAQTVPVINENHRENNNPA